MTFLWDNLVAAFLMEGDPLPKNALAGRSVCPEGLAHFCQ